MVIVLANACLWPAIGVEKQIDLDEKTYDIDPPTLLHSLAQGNKNVFTLQTATPNATSHWSSQSVSWKQADYFFIAQSFHQFVFGESLDSWKLSKMYFRLDCNDSTTGLQQAGFTFFKSVSIRDRDSRLMRYINIAPRENKVYFSETEFYPELDQWQFIDFAQIKISAESAVQIAEDAGGSIVRLEADNNCYIMELFDASGKYNGWTLWYSSEDKTIFDINIDPFTGEYRVVQ
jgi:hypothetical protein